MYNQPAIVSGTTFHPEVKYGQTGKPYANFSIGVPKFKKNQQTGKWDEFDKMIYYKCVCFGKNTEIVGQMVDKGTTATVVVEYSPNEFEGKTHPQFIVKQILALKEKQPYQQQPAYGQPGAATPQPEMAQAQQPTYGQSAPQPAPQAQPAGAFNSFESDVAF